MLFEKNETYFGTLTAPFSLEIPMDRDSSQKEACQNPKYALPLSNSKV